MNRLNKWFQTEILKRNCLNCAYLCSSDNGNSQSPMPENRRVRKTAPLTSTEIMFLPAHWTSCFLDEWARSKDMHSHEVELRLIARFGSLSGASWTEIRLDSGTWLALDKHKCDGFQKSDPTVGNPLELTQQGHQQRKQEANERHRFWIPTIISALALGISGLGIWRPWK